MAFEKPAVVIDNGSYTMKAGFSCDNHPLSMFRSVVGRPQYLNGAYGKEPYDVYVGDSAVDRADELDLNRPIRNGRVVQWDNLERLWHHAFYRELKVAPEERTVLLSVSPTTPCTDKVKMCEIYFETLNSPGVCIQAQSVLTLYGSGLTTGITVDLGHDTTEITPCFEGGPVQYAYMNAAVAGAQLHTYISNKLLQRGYDFGSKHAAIVENILRECCYYSPELGGGSSVFEKKTHVLPDGTELDVTEEARAPELVFKPEEIGGGMSLHEATLTTAMKCDPELRIEMLQGVAVCGGLATLPGLASRLAVEMGSRLPTPVIVLPSTEAHSVAWLGGSTFAGLPDASKVWVMQKQFDEYGAKIVRNKFL